MQESKKINPLIAVAAVSVTLFSLIGIAMMTGVLPNSFSKSSDTALESVAPKAAEKQTAKSAANTPAAPKATTKTAATKTPPASPAQTRPESAKAAPVCGNCGVVTSVDTIKLQGDGSGLGAVAGGVVGGLLGNQVGGGSGKKIATVAGAAGGAYAGHQAEKHLKSTVRYDVTVRMDDGSTRTFSYDAQPAYQAGSKVRVVDGVLTTG